MSRLRRGRWAALMLLVASLVAGAASTAEAQPSDPEPGMTCEEMEQAGFPQEDVDFCRDQERQQQCEELNQELPPEDQTDCENPPARDPCIQFAAQPDVYDLCDAFGDFFVLPDRALHNCVDLETFEIQPRCQPSEQQFQDMLGAWHTDHDASCQEERSGEWYELERLNLGFPRVYERVCLAEGLTAEGWRPAHVGPIGVIMAIEEHEARGEGPLSEGGTRSPWPVCASWNPGLWSETFWYAQMAGDIRVPLNTICDTLNDLGWPAYRSREVERTAHPGCDAAPTEPNHLVATPWGADLLPDGCWGSYPASNYDIGYDAAEWHEFGRWMWGNSTAFAYSLGKGTTTLALWLVDWAFIGFDIRKYDDGIGGNAAEQFADNLIRHPQLPFIPLAWLLLLAWVGYTVLRGRLAIAGTELLLSIVLVGLSTVLLAQQQEYMDATWGLMDQASTALLAAGQGVDPVDYEAPEGADPETARQYRRQLVSHLNGSIFDAFVEQPYDHLNWGEPLGDADDSENGMRACAEQRDSIVARGPWNTEDQPRDDMRDGGDSCERLADFNEEPSGERFFAAILTMAASIILGVFIALVALTVVVAKLLAVLIFALAPFAALVAILPGSGRRLAWSWITAWIQVVIAVVGMSFLLSFLLLAVDGLLGSTEDAHLVERFFLLNLVVFILCFARRRLLTASQSFAGRLGDYWATTRGTGAVWSGAGPGAGIDLLGADRALTRTALVGTVAVSVPLILAGRSAATRWREKRMIGRHFKNHKRMTRWRYDEYGTI